MLGPERTRKPSISDIIDVLNLTDGKVLSWDISSSSGGELSSQPHYKKFPDSSLDLKETILNSKNDDLDSGYSESPTRESPSSIYSASSDEYSPSWSCNVTEFSLPACSLAEPSHEEKHRFFEGDYIECLDSPTSKDESSNRTNIELDTSNPQPTQDFDSMHDSSSLDGTGTIQAAPILNEENLLKLATESVNKTKLSIEAASSLLNSKDDAVIIVLEEDRTVKYMSTSRQKLEHFLISETDPLRVTSPYGESVTTIKACLDSRVSPALVDWQIVQPHPTKRRGRKRVYEPDKSEAERGDKKRERNNEACRKFRRSRKVVQKDLFDQESVLLQHNLNLKEQVAALSRQLTYMKEKLCMQD